MKQSATNLEIYQSIFKPHKLKTTPERVAIFRIFQQATTPLSVADIFKKLSKMKIDQATVYRNVQTLQKIGLVNIVNFEHDHHHYEIANHAHHHHLICIKCNKVVDISKCNIKALEQEALEVSGFISIDHHAIEIFGTCKQCKNK